MRIVITPDALQHALQRSKFGKCTLKEWSDKNFTPKDGLNGDELFYFRYPSLTDEQVAPILENEMNCDGDLMEVIDWSKDLTSIDVDLGGGRTKNITVEPDTVLYYR